MINRDWGRFYCSPGSMVTPQFWHATPKGAGQAIDNGFWLRSSSGPKNQPQADRGMSVVAKCANPDCPAPFLYLREGRLFVMSSSSRHSRELGRENGVRYAWLCHDCGTTLAVEFEAGKGLRVVPLESSDIRFNRTT